MKIILRLGLYGGIYSMHKASYYGVRNAVRKNIFAPSYVRPLVPYYDGERLSWDVLKLVAEEPFDNFLDTYRRKETTNG